MYCYIFSLFGTKVFFFLLSITVCDLPTRFSAYFLILNQPEIGTFTNGNVYYKIIAFRYVRCNVRTTLHQWFQKKTTTDRRQRVVVDGEVSSWKSVLSGVPQGSVLGPILLLVYINV